jgi:hypothetical protein
MSCGDCRFPSGVLSTESESTSWRRYEIQEAAGARRFTRYRDGFGPR